MKKKKTGDREQGAVTPGGRVDLARAAGAVDAELGRFEELSALARRVPLTSQKNLEKAAGAVRDAADSQTRVGEQLKVLVEAIASASRRHLDTVESLNGRSEEIRAKNDDFTGLLVRFDALGDEARQINETVGRVMKARGDSPTTENFAEIVAMLEEVGVSLSGVVDRAAELARAADAAAFTDLARQADSLRQQVHASRNKVNLLRESLAAR